MNNLYSICYGYGIFVVRASSEDEAAQLVADAVEGATVETVKERGRFKLLSGDGPSEILDDYWA